jgi:hypothetical protein
MLDTTRPSEAPGSTTGNGTPIRAVGDAPPASIPPGHVGPVFLPGSGRLVWWTGRVAIGLRHERPAHHETMGSSALWVQGLMLQRAA